MPNETHDGYYEAYWPRAPRQGRSRPLAKRLASLQGKTIAQLWDYMFKGDQVFTLLEEALVARFPGIRFLSWREFGNTHSSNEKDVLANLPRRFKELGVDAVISGMAC